MIAILSNIVMIQNVQAQLSSATVSEIEKSIDEIRNVCSMTDDLEAIGWGIAKPVEIFSEIGSESIPHLTEVLSDKTEDYKTRFFIAVILGEVLPDTQSTPYLLKVFQDESEPEILRRECATAIGFIKDTTATSVLIENLDNPSTPFRITVINALGQIANKRSIPHLIKLLNDNNKDIQMVSARALGLIGDKSALDVLMKKIQEENPTNDRYVNSVKANAISALVSIGGDDVEDFLIEILVNGNSDNVKMYAAAGLGTLKSRKAIPILIKQLDSDNELLRMDAAKSLVLIGAVEAEKSIKEALDNTKSKYVRSMMRKALDKLSQK
ncbi:HEAT repeat domain-containing protein [candidate division WOR-3 bacterium]|nr:HEAT repeat domain-containing protein [candidate division WOR-3 bacterium]